MATLTTLIDRVEAVLGEEDLPGVIRQWSRDRIRQSLISEAFALARAGHLGEILCIPAHAGQAIYDETDEIPGHTVSVRAVLYDGRSLKPMGKDTMARYEYGWEARQRTPQTWSHALQAPTQIRVAPAPLEEGQDVLNFPILPMPRPIEKNLLLFLHNALIARDLPESEQTQVPDPWEEIMVANTIATLSNDESEASDPVRAAAFQQLGLLLTQAIES